MFQVAIRQFYLLEPQVKIYLKPLIQVIFVVVKNYFYQLEPQVKVRPTYFLISQVVNAGSAYRSSKPTTVGKAKMFSPVF